MNVPLSPPPRRPVHRTFRRGEVALKFNMHALGLATLALMILTVLVIWATTLGSISIPFGEVIEATLGRGTKETEFAVRTLRLPRVLVAVFTGACLAMSGSIFQGIARNPLVSPDIIGIRSGATLCAVTWMILDIGPSEMLPLAAFIGAIVAAAAVYGFSWKGGISMNRLILVGIGVGAMIGAGSTFMTVKFPIEIARPAIVWTMGSVYASNWNDVVLLVVSLALLCPIAVFLMGSLRTLQFGDSLGRSLGVSLERTRLTLIVVACALPAVAVALAGPIGFVALIVPHMARMIAGPPTGSVLVFTALLGAIMLLGSDVIAQHFLPVSLPVGAITGAVGAPYFLYLLYRTNLRI